MKEIALEIQESKKTYTISLGPGLINDAARLLGVKEYSRVCILTDENVAPRWLKSLQEGLGNEAFEIIIPAGERQKTMQTVSSIWQELSEHRLDRKSLIVNLGGGVVGDVGGFVASTYMRGIAYVQVPTSLLAQADASVGGKTGVDFAGLKNIVGSFYQPRAVIIDVHTLSTLPAREFISGFAEIMKHGLIADKEYFSRATSKRPKEFSFDELEKIIETSCKIKAHIASQDEKEGKLRKLLNFGHTVGHALEAIRLETPDPLLHGEAVSIGMVAEARMSVALGLLSNKDASRIEIALEHAGLPTQAQRASTKEIIACIAGDKKSKRGKVGWTLLSSLGKAIVDKEVPDEIAKKAIASILA